MSIWQSVKWQTLGKTYVNSTVNNLINRKITTIIFTTSLNIKMFYWLTYQTQKTKQELMTKLNIIKGLYRKKSNKIILNNIC